MDVPTAAFLASLSVTAVLDLRKHVVPNLITLPLLAAGLILGASRGGIDGFVTASLSAAALFGVGFAAYAMGGMGGGDVKLMAAIGAWMGLNESIDALLLASFIGVAWGLVKYARAGILRERIVMFIRGVYLKLFCRVKGDIGWQKLPEDIAAPVPKEAVPFGTCLAAAVMLLIAKGWWGL